MINRYSSIILLLVFALVSCEKERDTVIESGVPDSIELVKTGLSGKVTDKGLTPLANVVVKVMYENWELGRTTTQADGHFEFKAQAVQKEKTYLVFEKEGYSPNISNQLFEENGSILLQPILKPLSVDQALANTASEVQLGSQIKVSLPAEMVNGSNPKLRLQYFDFEAELKNNMLAELATDGKIEPSKVIWLDVVNDQNQSLPWESNAEATFIINNEIKKNFSSSIWYFDPLLARWIKKHNLITENGQTYFKVKKSGFYAFVNPCLADSEKPVPYCLNNITVLLTQGPNLLHASDFNAGSYDNCDDNLDFKIRRSSDLCGNGDDVFKPYISLCPGDAGKNFTVVIKVTDDFNNSDSVVINVSVAGNAPCSNDNKKPIPYCKTNVDVSFAANSGTLPANFFDAGSYDDCSSPSDLEFLVKKVQTDICGNGSNTLSQVLKFCTAEIGKTLEIETHVYDQNGNSDFCTIMMHLKP